MEQELEKMAEVIEEKLPAIINALKETDATTTRYNELLTNFNSSMVIYSQIKTMFAARKEIIKLKEEEDNGINN